MPVIQHDSENADRDLTSQVTVLTHTPNASNATVCQAVVHFGDGAKDLDGSGGLFEMTVTVGGQTVQPDPQIIEFSTAVRAAVQTGLFAVPANQEVVVKAKSPNAADSDVDVTAYLIEVTGALPAAAPDAAGGFPISDAGGLDLDNNVQNQIEAYHLDHLLAADYDPSSKPGVATALLNELIENDGGVSRFTANALEQGPDTTTGVTLHGDYDAAKTAAQAGDQMNLANDAITSAKYDESSAYPFTAANVRTAVGMSSANLDTQLSDIPTVAEMEARTLVAASYATSANQTTIAGYIDTEVQAIIDAVAALHDFDPANDKVYLADGAHGGSSATITALSVAVTNTNGDAVAFTSSGGNGSGLALQGNGTGSGLTGLGGNSGHGFYGSGEGVAGHGMYLLGTQGGDGLYCAGGTNRSGGVFIGSGSGDGLRAAGGATGQDIEGDIHGTIDACTTNTDMRGTDGANTTVPDAAGTAAALHGTTDALIGALNDYDGSDTAGTTTLLTRLSADRAGYLDKLNVSGTLAHSDAAATYKATGFSTHDAAAVITAMGTGSFLTGIVLPTNGIPAAALSDAAVTKIEAALLNEGDGQQLIDAIVQAIDAADIENDVIPGLVRDAILNRVLSGNHDTAGTVGKLLQFLDAAVSSRSSHTAANVRTEMDSNSTQLAAIVGDTNELQTDWANGGRLDTLLDTAAATGGSGARTVTITVNDGSDPLENAKVRVTNGLETYVLSTNASGQAVFSLDDATWTVAITKPLYTFTSTTLVVSADTSQTYSMSADSVPSSDPDKVTGYLTCLDEEGDPEENAEVELWIIDVPASGTGYAYDKTVRTGTSGATGLVSFTGLIPGATYTYRRGTASGVVVTIPSDASVSVALDSLIGKD